ncbi:MAG: HAD-IA family hydrolase [Bacteroidetes bacterium]|nr:HAD-IA family hydrolase [Bacteroidota bacterium]
MKKKISGSSKKTPLIHPPIRTLLLDIGMVILTNGWDRYSRKRAAQIFGINEEEFSDRHKFFFDSFEAGRMTLHEYLQFVVFYVEREFTETEFITFMLSQSKPIRGSMEYFMALKKRHNLKIISLNNEGRELNEYRIKTFHLDKLFDAYLSSCYVHLRKSDKEFFLMGCDISNTPPENCLFIDDRLIHVQIARTIGLNAVQFTGLSAAKKQIAQFGLEL